MPENNYKTWVCSVCGYIHYGSEPPDECPVCGAARDQFTLSVENEVSASAETPSVTVRKAVVVGAGIAGVSAAEAIRKSAPQADITLVSSETYLPYYRLNLTRYLAGEIDADHLTLHPELWYNLQNIRLLRNTEARSLDLEHKELSLSPYFCANRRHFYSVTQTQAISTRFQPPEKYLSKQIARSPANCF